MTREDLRQTVEPGKQGRQALAQTKRQEMFDALPTAVDRQRLNPSTDHVPGMGRQGLEVFEALPQDGKVAQLRQCEPPAECWRCEGMCDGIRKKLSVVTKAQAATNQKNRFTAGMGFIAR